MLIAPLEQTALPRLFYLKAAARNIGAACNDDEFVEDFLGGVAEVGKGSGLASKLAYSPSVP